MGVAIYQAVSIAVYLHECDYSLYGGREGHSGAGSETGSPNSDYLK